MIDVETLFMLNMIVMWIESIHYFVFNMYITFISSFDCSHVSIAWVSISGRNRIWRLFRVFCLLSVKVSSWYKTHSKTGILPGVWYVFILSVSGIHFGPVIVSFKAFSGHKTMMYTPKVGFTILNNLIQHRGLDCHFILQIVSRY